MTPEKLDDIATALYWSLSIDTDKAALVPEEEIQKIAAALRKAIEEEREACAAVAEGFGAENIADDIRERGTN